MAKREYEVALGNLYLRVNGKMQEQKKGTRVTLDESVAKARVQKGHLVDAKNNPTVKVDQKPKDDVPGFAKQST